MKIQDTIGLSRRVERVPNRQKNIARRHWSVGAIYFELKRRGVLEAGASYTLIAWLIAQVAELIGEVFETPAWILQALLVALAIGLPISLFLAWAFELTPSGLKPNSEISPTDAVTPKKGRVFVCGLIAILVLTIGALAIGREPGGCAITPQADGHLPGVSGNSSVALYFRRESTKLDVTRRKSFMRAIG